MEETTKKNYKPFFVIVLFTILTGWWLLLQTSFPASDLSNKLFGESYGLIAFLGAIYGIQISRAWGGTRSLMGKSILMFALGLLAQEFGQLSYAYYVFYKNIEIPYPSIGDIGFFGSIPFYIFGIVYLGQASGVKFSLKSFSSKLQALLIPMLILFFSYVIFLQGYDFDWSSPLVVFLDFGYPLGEAIYISLALLAYLLSRRLLGGVMKFRILFILAALLIQFLSDFSFLYQAKNGTFVAGGVVDLMYLVSYLAMTLGLLNLNVELVKKNLE